MTGKIITERLGSEWTAYRENAPDIVGRGPTEQAAINDLIDQEDEARAW